MAELAVVFPTSGEFEKARRALAEAGAAFRTVEPPAEVAEVAVPMLLVPDGSRGALVEALRSGIVAAGQVPYRPPAADVLADLPPLPTGVEDVVGRVTVVFVGPCTTLDHHLRLAAQVEGDLAPVLPYLAAELPSATYAPADPTLTWMDGPRLLTLYPHRVALARAAEMVDAWRTLAKVRRMVLDVWSRRSAIRPLTEPRRAVPTPLEIFTRLPGTNCGACGEATCLAFAAALLAGRAQVEACRPVFEGEFGHLRADLEKVTARLGA